MRSAYEQGFVDKCASYGVDPVKLAQALDTPENVKRDVPIPLTDASRAMNRAPTNSRRVPLANYVKRLAGAKQK